MKDLTNKKIVELLRHKSDELAFAEEKLKMRTEQLLNAKSAEDTKRKKEGVEHWANDIVELRTQMQLLRDELDKRKSVKK